MTGFFVNSEPFKLLIASGEPLPDMFLNWVTSGCCGNVPFPDQLEDGLIRSIPRKMINQYMPNYVKQMENYPMVWLLKKVPDIAEDEYYGITGIFAGSAAWRYTISTRLDYMRNVGFNLPDYEQSKITLMEDRAYFYDKDITLEMVEDLLRAYRDGDPDGNGKIDTIPYVAHRERGRVWHAFMGAFGVPKGNGMENGVLYDERVSPGMKRFLKRMAQWYAEGLIDREFATLEGDEKIVDKIKSGSVGIADAGPIYIGMGDYGDPLYSFISDDDVAPGVETIAFRPPIGPDGHQGIRSKGEWSFRGGPWSVGGTVNDEKLIKILQIYDFYRGTDAGYIMWNIGKEGVHWNWSGQPWASSVESVDPKDYPAGYPVKGPLGGYPHVVTPSRMILFMTKDLVDFHRNILFSPEHQALTIYPYRSDAFNETNLADVNKKYNAALDTIYDEFFYAAIMGDVDVDEEWDAYVEKFMKSGGEEVMAELAKAPLTSALQKGRVEY